MELGNIFFGNSRGTYPIPDRKSYQDEFARIYHESSLDYYDHFENDVFIHFPYYWGDCTCGFDEKDYKWSESNKHTEECFHTRIWKFNDSLEMKDRYNDEDNKLAKWCAENGFNYDDGGCLAFCDCGHDEQYGKWREVNNHDSDCPTVKPNFVYKPTGLEIQWYKYALRDSYTNMEISLNELRNVIDHCITSLKDE